MLKQIIKSVPMVQRRCLYSSSTSLTKFSPIRRLYSSNNGNDTKVLESIANANIRNEEGVSAIKEAKLSLCQINNHPDYRLQQAKARLADNGSISGDIPPIDTNNNTTPIVIENKVRSNDGTSSGALIEDRLRLARRRALENASQPITQPSSSSSSKAGKSTPPQSSTQVTKVNFSIENPVRSNDGTSSGAVVADRLRLARRKALKAASRPIKPSSSTSSSSKADNKSTPLQSITKSNKK